MSKFIGRRIVPTHGGVWEQNKEYEELTIVLNEDSGNSYISRIPVPAGTAITDEKYWMLYSIYSAQIAEAVKEMEETEKQLTEHVEETAKQLTQHVDETEKSVNEHLDETEKSVLDRVSEAEKLTDSNKDTLNSRMETIEKRLDANVRASGENHADYAAELVDARVGADGTEYGSAGTNIRSVASGTGLVDHAVGRNKIKDITFDQIDFDGLDVLGFESLEVTKGKQFIGYDTETFLPIYRDVEGVTDGVIYDFLISELTDRGITQIYIPTDSPLTQKFVLYTAGEKAQNTWFKSQTVENGMYVVPINNFVKGYERVAISFHKDNTAVECIRDCSTQTENRILKWVGTKDLKDGAVTSEKLDSDITKHLNHYPFDYTKETQWQTEFGRRHEEGLIPYIQLYDCNPDYDYGVGAIYRNHVKEHKRYVSLAKYDRDTHELVETVAAYSAVNEDEADPQFVEAIRIRKSGETVADIVIDWTKETLNDWRGYEIFQPGIAVPYARFDEDELDDKYLMTQSDFNDWLHGSFSFNGNIASKVTGQHRRSTGFDTTTRLPIWTASDNYREFTVEITPYGSYRASRRNTEDTQVLQIYLLRADGTVIMNYQDKALRTDGGNGLSVTETEVLLDCVKAYKWGARFISITFDLRQTPDFYIKAEGNQIPSWLNTDKLRDMALVSTQIETVLPSKLRVCGGVEMNVYYPNIVRYLNTEKCQLVRPTSTFSNYGSFARWTPAADSSKSFDTKFGFSLVDTYAENITSSVLSVSAVPKTTGNGVTKKVMFIGDSLTDADAFSAEIVRMFEADGMNVELLGTLGSGANKNEGRSGWRAYTYVKCAQGSDDLKNLGFTNPFYDPEKGGFDFSYYMEQQGYEGVDYVFICLGTNDTARGNHKTEAELKELWDYMIDSIHEYDSSIRIGLWLPPTRSLMANRDRRAIDSSLWMNKWIISTYDNREDERLYLVPVYLNVDPYHDYRYQEVQVSNRNPDFKMVIDSDSVHPSSYGYYKIADVMYSYIKYFAYLDEA